jgi:predicted  nucleic acid-binding Zn-ribbon protein
MVKDNIKYKGCPHCGSKAFYTMGDPESKDKFVVLRAAKEKDDGSFEQLDGKAIYGIPLICDECDFIQLFRA